MNEYFNNKLNIDYLTLYKLNPGSNDEFKNYLISEFHNIAKQYIKIDSFRGYPVHIKEDMISYAIEKGLDAGSHVSNVNYGVPKIFRFDTTKTNSSLFSYWTQCVKNSYKKFLKKYYLDNDRIIPEDSEECQDFLNEKSMFDWFNAELKMRHMQI